MRVIEVIWPFLALMGFLTAITFLRTLAIYRQRQIEAHDVAREAVRMRRAYEKSEQERRDNPLEA